MRKRNAGAGGRGRDKEDKRNRSSDEGRDSGGDRARKQMREKYQK